MTNDNPRTEDPQTIADAAQTGDVGLVRAQLDAVAPLYGVRLNRARLEAWARFDARIGIVDKPPDVGRAFDFTLTPYPSPTLKGPGPLRVVEGLSGRIRSGRRL